MMKRLFIIVFIIQVTNFCISPARAERLAILLGLGIFWGAILGFNQ